MKKLSKSIANQAGRFIIDNARPLERAIYEYHFNKGEARNILEELKKFQNNDGGFGKGIESDFRLPHSSPMATSVGLRLLSQVDDLKGAQQQIRLAVQYLEKSFNHNRNAWFAVTKEVNHFPHTPWWHYDEKESKTVIDRNWGNPSAEIIAYLYKYRDYLEQLNSDDLVRSAIDYIEKKEKFDSENEIYCYIELYHVLPQRLNRKLENKISKAIHQVIVYEEQNWDDYVPRPLDFVVAPDKNKFGVDSIKIDKQLDYLIEQLEKNTKIDPPWGPSYYQGDMIDAYKEWQGVLTLNALLLLHQYRRIEQD